PAAAAANAAPETPDLGTKAAVREQVVGRRASADRTWQKRLLPVMVGLLVTLTAFFFVASFVQLYYLQTRIERAPRLDLSSSLTTASPGLVLATLGTALMLATLATSMDLQVNDGPVYLRDQPGTAASAPPLPLAREDAAQKPRSDADILKDLKTPGAPNK